MVLEDPLQRPPSYRPNARIRVDDPTVNDLHELIHNERRARSVALGAGKGTPAEVPLRAARKRMDRLLSEIHRAMDDLGIEWIDEAPENVTVPPEG